MTDPEDQLDQRENPSDRIPLKRRLVYVSIIYLVSVLILLAVEVGTRLTMSHVSSLDLFVVTAQQKAQVADSNQSGIFEGDPLLLWRLKPNLDKIVWDFTVLSTNSDHLRSEQSIPIAATETAGDYSYCLSRRFSHVWLSRAGGLAR